MESVGSAGPRGKVLFNQKLVSDAFYFWIEPKANSEITGKQLSCDLSELRDFLGYYKYTRTCFEW